eukprot:m.58324 g.58324  ORF g.58324 m.58324 type:complete len:1692 (+) comp22530_c0_seq4:272-5347(+)
MRSPPIAHATMAILAVVCCVLIGNGFALAEDATPPIVTNKNTKPDRDTTPPPKESATTKLRTPKVAMPQAAESDQKTTTITPTDSDEKQPQQCSKISGTAYAKCKNIIVGAGWSGSYFAYRTTVDEKHFDVSQTCIFEASERIGGRAYSRPGIPGLQDLRVDLGAYRWDQVNHPLVNHVMTEVLNVSTRCYDDPVCSNYSSLTNVRDAYGNNFGYASGPEGLIEKFTDAGGQLFFKHELTAVDDGTGEGFSLTFDVRTCGKSTIQLPADVVFLNTPASAVKHLKRTGPLFQDETVKHLLLTAPAEYRGSKMFLVYDHTPWRVIHTLTETNGDDNKFTGTEMLLFANASAPENPALNGRLGDFYGKCPASSQRGQGCIGAIMVFYSFGADDKHLYYQSKRQHPTEPYSYFAYGSGNVEDDLMIITAHTKFQNALVYKAATNILEPYKTKLSNQTWFLSQIYVAKYIHLAQNNAGPGPDSFATMFNHTEANRQAFRDLDGTAFFIDLAAALDAILRMTPPTGAVISNWGSTLLVEELGKNVSLEFQRQYLGSHLDPGPSGLKSRENVANEPNQIVYDANHAARNIISRPLPRRNLFIANEAYSSGNGWAHPAMLMTEQLIHQHLIKDYPSWVTPACKDCITGSINGDKCFHCVSRQWYDLEIRSSPEVTPLLENCTCAEKDDVLKCDPKTKSRKPSTTDGSRQCFVNLATTEQLHDEKSCDTGTFTLYGDNAVSWVWKDDVVTVTAQIHGEGWAAVGFGDSMVKSDMIVASCEMGKNNMQLYNSTGYSPPRTLTKTETLESYITVHPPSKDDMNCNAQGINTNKLFVLRFDIDTIVNPNVIDDKGTPTSMMFAYSSQPATLDKPRIKKKPHTRTSTHERDKEMTYLFPNVRHDVMFREQIPLHCNKKNHPVTFDQDIKPLFRTKDIQAMKFAFDLTSHAAVKAHYPGILSVLEDRTLYHKATGMPPDEPWSLANLNKFYAWNAAGLKKGDEGTSTNKPADTTCPDFYPKIAGLFRDEDVSAMNDCCKMDLRDYDVVKLQAQNIYTYVAAGKMPCQPKDRWSSDKLDLFSKWMSCGYPKGKENKLLDDREMFLLMWNESMDEKLQQKAKDKMASLLTEARATSIYPFGVTGVNPDRTDAEIHENALNVEIENHRYREAFNYTPDEFNRKIDAWYETMARNNVLTDPVTGDPTDGGAYVIPEDFKFQALQTAPWNLIDGAWLMDACNTGPMDDITGLLWGILDDEMGNGNRNHNHCNLYNFFLESLGIYVPPVNTYDFVYNSGILASGFTQPAYVMGLKRWGGSLYFPELLGSTLNLETGAVGLQRLINTVEFLGLDPKFYVLHQGIDNAADGHSYRARRAIMLYMDKIRLEKGEDEMQKAWRRVWDGFLAFDAIGSSGSEINDYLFNNQANTPRQAVIKMMQHKAKYGKWNHHKARLGNKTIDELFGDPELFIINMETSPWVVAGDPTHSAVMDYLTTFDGPMFKVFTMEELETWRTWITSLSKNRKYQKSQGAKLDVFNAMSETMQRVVKAGMAEVGHRTIYLWGPSPNAQLDSISSETAGIPKRINQPVQDWLDTITDSPVHMMRALADQQNNLITCGDSNSSRFLYHVLQPSTKMGKMYNRIAANERQKLDDPRGPKDGLWRWIDIVKVWIDEGCPFEKIKGETYSLFPPIQTQKKGSRASIKISGKVAMH